MEALAIFKDYINNSYSSYSMEKNQTSTVKTTKDGGVLTVLDVLTIKNKPESKIKIYSYKVKDKPSSLLRAIMPNTNLMDAEKILKDKYGERLLMVVEYKPHLKMEARYKNRNQ